MMTKRFLTAFDIAEVLGVHVANARTLIQAKIPHIRVGNNEYRVAAEDFENYLERAKIAPLYPDR